MDNTYMSKETQEKRFQELIQKAEALGYTLEYDKQLDPNKRSSLWNYRYIAHLKINDDISIHIKPAVCRIECIFAKMGSTACVGGNTFVDNSFGNTSHTALFASETSGSMNHKCNIHIVKITS